MPWELPEVLDPDLAREGLKQLDPINHIACTLAPDPIAAICAGGHARSLLVHAQSTAAGYRLGEHGAFAGGSCAARGCRALRKTRGHGARHRSAEYQVSIGGSAQPAGAARHDPAPEDRICRAHCQMDRPAAAISHLGVEAHSLAAIASMPLVATLGVFCRMRGLNRAVSRHRSGSVRRIWRNCRVQS